jgi:hypothetical protein
MLILRLLIVGMMLGLVDHVLPAAARGAGVPIEDRWNPQHITGLPAEIRSAVTHMCGQSIAAEHLFATYLQGSRLIILHFEHVRCDHRGSLCTQAGCLHQVYVSTGAHYRLLRSYYGPNGD